MTFDDGYLDNYHAGASGSARSLDVPAIVSSRRRRSRERALGWWDLIAYLLKKERTRPEFEFQGRND